MTESHLFNDEIGVWEQLHLSQLWETGKVEKN